MLELNKIFYNHLWLVLPIYKNEESGIITKLEF